MASYIGKSISLISQSDIRYCGILHNVDPVQQTIQLANVYSMGTENRRPVSDYIGPHPVAYDFILFRAPEVKDISLETTPSQPPLASTVQNDPAVIGVTQGPGPAQRYEAYGFNSNPAINVPQVPGTIPAPIPAQPTVHSAAPIPAPAAVLSHSSTQNNQSSQSHPHRRRETNGRQPSTNTARTALQSVERAMGDLRVEAARNGKRTDETQMQVFATDFDFETSNAKFNKAALVEDSDSGSESDAETNPSNAGDNNGSKKEKEKKTKEPAYNPSKSFFDSLTPNSLPARGGGAGGQGRGGGRGGRGRGGGYGRSRREEEAQRNLMTFGEAMPVTQSSWGGRRGGRRGGSGSGGIPGRGTFTNGRTS